jgi:uncharacterized membrane protein YgdD (TMEM256/DUF423 family)
MNCAGHPVVSAVAQCVSCSRGLCVTCADIYQPPMCGNCATQTAAHVQQDIRKEALVTAGLFALGALIGKSAAANAGGGLDSIGLVLFGGWLVAGIPYGWKALPGITPLAFIWMPLMGWLIYFWLKGSVATLVGIFIFPFKVIFLLRNLAYI